MNDRELFRAFKAKGLSLSADASRALCSVLAREVDKHGSLQLILQDVMQRIEKREIRSTLIDVDTITSIVADLTSSEEDLAMESTQLLDAFTYPRIVYDERQKTYRLEKLAKFQIHGDAECRANMYRQRLLLMQQRLIRSKHFTLRGRSRGTSSVGQNAQYELSTIESLLGSTGTKFLFGMLTQPEEGAWFLEDLSSIIKLDLSQAQTLHVLYTLGSIVIVEGELVNGVFRVDFMGFPPAEERNVCLNAMGLVDTFGNDTRPNQILHLEEMERNSIDTTFIIMSDLQLDRPNVIEKLQQVFEGYEQISPAPLFILMGSFVTKSSRAPNGRDVTSSAFTALADAICSCPNLAQNAKFLLVPGPEDPGCGVALPRRAIPEEYTKELRRRVKHVSFASNPSRVRFYTQEIVLFREDLIKKMQRHCVLPPTLAGAVDVSEQLVQTIIEQAHLCPLPMQVKPIIWDLDHALRLSPLPHLLVLADHAEQYCYTSQGCIAVNPGSFSSDCSFLVYRPADKTVEFSRLP